MKDCILFRAIDHSHQRAPNDSEHETSKRGRSYMYAELFYEQKQKSMLEREYEYFTLRRDTNNGYH